MVITGTLLRGDQVRHISADVIGATRGTVLATFLDLENKPVAAVQWQGGYMGVSRLKWLDRALAKPISKEPQPVTETVDHPPHCNAHPSGVECIDVVEHMTFNLGNAVKYIWRADHKDNAVEDLRKAAWYVQREIERVSKGQAEPVCTCVAWRSVDPARYKSYDPNCPLCSAPAEDDPIEALVQEFSPLATDMYRDKLTAFAARVLEVGGQQPGVPVPALLPEEPTS